MGVLYIYALLLLRAEFNDLENGKRLQLVDANAFIFVDDPILPARMQKPKMSYLFSSSQITHLMTRHCHAKFSKYVANRENARGPDFRKGNVSVMQARTSRPRHSYEKRVDHTRNAAFQGPEKSVHVCIDVNQANREGRVRFFKAWKIPDRVDYTPKQAETWPSFRVAFRLTRSNPRKGSGEALPTIFFFS